MKIVVLNGSPRKKDGYNIIKKLEKIMSSKADIEFDMINLSEVNVSPCVGCMQCFQVSEKKCPVKDDIESIKNRLVCADGVILSSPVYAINITGQLKLVIDRLSYLFHRPEFVGKPFLNLTTTAGGGIKETLKYLKLVATGWGGDLVGSFSVTSPLYFEESEFYNHEYHIKLDKKINTLCTKFLNQLQSSKPKSPSFYAVMTFHALRSKTYTSKADYDYWNERGWLKSSYYYPVKVNPIYNCFGKMLSHSINRYFQKRYKQSSTRGL